ncbi:MAG: carboxypeptidase-like regulatory domain-containing protein, partial [Ferruginibacter sp.]
MKRFLSLLSMLMLFGGLTFAQDHSVKGRVTDETGRALLGISVTVKGSTIGTATDASGQYEIAAPVNSTLTFTGIGFEDMTVKVGNRASIDVTLKSTAKELGTVVVTALGLQSKNDDLTTSQSRVTGSSITQSGENNVLNALASKASGVQIVSSGGEPGSSAYMQIRGQSTITGDLQPLFVVDGVPVSNSSLG